MSSMKEIAIRDYVSKIDFKNDDWKLPSLQNQNWLTFPLTKYLRSTKEISEKAKLTLNFMKRKMSEYEELKSEIKKK